MSKGPWKSRPTKKSQPGWFAFAAHRDKAKQRGIAFLFDYETWWAWWQVDNRWEQRGNSRGKLCMARRGDVGPYSPENVYCTTHEGNQADVPTEVRREINQRVVATTKANGSHGTPWKGVREGHPMSRPVVTPLGRFGSAALAAEAYGMNPSSATSKARKAWKGWRYEDAS